MAQPQDAKQQLRDRHATARAALRRDAETKARLDAAIVEHTLACLRHFGALGAAIAAYNPLPSEPGPANFAARLAAHCEPVWLPISLDDATLAWATATSGLTPGALGIAEPAGERHSSEVLDDCDLIVVPALAVDATGMRLGKGAGYYDRALAGRSTPTAAVVFDDELVDAVPHDPHDVPVDAVITPSGFRVF